MKIPIQRILWPNKPTFKLVLLLGKFGVNVGRFMYSSRVAHVTIWKDDGTGS